MGSKTPLFIVGIGVAGMVVLGMMAHYVLNKDQRLQDLVKYRAQVMESFPITDVHVRATPEACEVALVLDVARCALPAAGAPLPSNLAGLAAHYRANSPFQPQAPRLRMRLSGPPPGGCRDASPAWEGEFPGAADLAAAEQALAAALAGSVQLTVVTPSELLVESSVSGDGERARRLVPLVAGLDGGGWRRLEFRLAGLRFAFDGQGQRVVQ